MVDGWFNEELGDVRKGDEVLHGRVIELFATQAVNAHTMVMQVPKLWADMRARRFERGLGIVVLSMMLSHSVGKPAARNVNFAFTGMKRMSGASARCF